MRNRKSLLSPCRFNLQVCDNSEVDHFLKIFMGVLWGLGRGRIICSLVLLFTFANGPFVILPDIFSGNFLSMGFIFTIRLKIKHTLENE